MLFERPFTVKETVNNIHVYKYLLRSIQREMVWEPDSISRLRNSLIRNYSLGSFVYFI